MLVLAVKTAHNIFHVYEHGIKYIGYLLDLIHVTTVQYVYLYVSVVQIYFIVLIISVARMSCPSYNQQTGCTIIHSFQAVAI